jgi:hypothetical protein
LTQPGLPDADKDKRTMNDHKNLSHPYLLWVIVVVGCSCWLFGTYQLYLLDGLHTRTLYTLFSGLPLAGIGWYLLYAIYAAQRRQRMQNAQQQEPSQGEVWPPPPSNNA